MTTDIVLVDEVKQGNKQSYGVLVSRHKKLILRLALRMTRDMSMAEDIVQDSFIKAYRKIHQFESRASFKSWLYQIALNTARNKLRSLKRRELVNIDKVGLAFQPQIERNIFQNDLKEIMEVEIDKLPPKQKLALSLRVFDDLSFQEIAEIMDCPYDTAKANYRHALMKLRHKFQNNMDLKELKNFIPQNEVKPCVPEVD